MGASGWSHFVPYQTDIHAVLQKVRQQVFERGEYYKAPRDELRKMTDAEMRAAVAGDPPEIQDIVLEEWRYLRSLPEPTTIERLIAWNYDSGTHSILDITKGVSAQPASGTVSALTDAQLQDLFGTTQPNRAMVSELLETYKLYDLRRRNQALYIIIYEQGTPSEICFAGFSGD